MPVNNSVPRVSGSVRVWGPGGREQRRYTKHASNNETETGISSTQVVEGISSGRCFRSRKGENLCQKFLLV